MESALNMLLLFDYAIYRVQAGLKPMVENLKTGKRKLTQLTIGDCCQEGTESKKTICYIKV